MNQTEKFLCWQKLGWDRRHWTKTKSCLLTKMFFTMHACFEFLNLSNEKRWGTSKVHRLVDVFPCLFCSGKISWNKTIWKLCGNIQNICFRARLKKGWVVWVPSCVFGESYPPWNCVSSLLFSFWNNGCLVQGLSLPLYTSLQTHCESSDQPNPPVVQKRDPLACPRFAVEKGVCGSLFREFEFFRSRLHAFSVWSFWQGETKFGECFFDAA